jgi:murein DD-endopeptidase MepM/ murein hydrolase activator NlpD
MALDLGKYLSEKKSPLAEHLPAIMSAANRYRIDPRLIIAISGGESSFGKAVPQGSHNAWGIGPGRRYKDWAEGIDAAARLLRENYVGKGLRTLQAIGAKWAPIGAGNDPTNLNSNWYRNNSAIYKALGGDPNNVNRGWRHDASPKAVAQLPSQGMPTTASIPPPSTTSFPGGLGAQAAFENLGRIARGESPQRTLSALVAASQAEEDARRAAQVSVREAPPEQEAPPEWDGPPVGRPPKGVKVVKPLSTPMSKGSEFGAADAEGAPSRNGGRYHAAKDWFAPAGAVVRAPRAGEIVEVKQSRGNSGQVFGGTVKIRGDDGLVYVFRHVDPLKLRVGERVPVGTSLARVSAWTDGSPHAHVEIWRTLEGGYTFENMIDPVKVFS